ncbi:MAG: hypothetical protein ACP5MV_03890 [Candidatus Parvarchaeum sp.]
MKIELLLGAMKNIETAKNGSPYEVIENIHRAKDKGIDVLIGPEWSLTCPPGVYTKTLIKKNKAKDAIDILFNAPDYVEYAPRDAKKILEAQIEDGLEIFDEVPRIPYSKREYQKLLNGLKMASRGSDMIIFPGTAMFYDENKVLYNVMPVVRDGELVKEIYKFRDGLGSNFNLNDELILYPTEVYSKSIYNPSKNKLKFTNDEKYQRFENIIYTGCTNAEPISKLSYGGNPIIHFNGLLTSAEICADAGLLSEMNVNNLDLQILSSCGNSSTESVINNSGYIAVVDGFKDVEIRVSGKHTPKLRPVEKSDKMYSFNLEFYL